MMESQRWAQLVLADERSFTTTVTSSNHTHTHTPATTANWTHAHFANFPFNYLSHHYNAFVCQHHKKKTCDRNDLKSGTAVLDPNAPNPYLDAIDFGFRRSTAKVTRFS